MSENKFTWLPFFKELLNSICKNSNPNSLYKEFKKFFPNSYNDINQLDPLTYICSICGGPKVVIERSQIAKESFNLKSNVISDITGIPSFVNANYKFFHEYYKNGKNMTPIMNDLWKFANDINNGIINESLFNKLLTYNAIKLAKLSQFIYICNPDKYFSCDTTMLSYIGNPSVEQNYSSFLKIQNICKEKMEKPYQLSEKAWYSLKSYNNLNQQKSKKFWLYAAGEKSYKWEEFYREGIIALGWDNLGDLKNFHSQDEMAQELQKYSSKDSYPKNDSKANWEFANKMNIGDIVYVKQGLEPILLGRGVVASDYIYDDIRNKYKSIRKVNWTHNGIYNVDFNELDIKQWNQKTLTDISENKYKDFCKKIEKIFNNNAKEDKNMNSQPLNQILYGPPGTGKTYSIQEYIQNLLRENPGLNTNSEEQKLNDIVKDLSWYTTIAISMYLNGEQNKYKVSDLMNQKIIKAFALTRENKNLRAALWAQMQIHTSEDCKTVNYTNRQAPFVFEKNENSEWYLTEDGIKYVEENLAEQIAQYKAPSNTRKIEDFYKFITFHQSYSYEEFVEGIKPKIDVNDDSSTISYEYNRGIFKEICQQANSDPDNKYLLIIDEINRGNISKIFGELITLIETNKRVRPNKERNFENTKVEKEQLLVTLPYTKSKFGVPSNLYILGTMNTSDRSIASIDIALRRRFKFVEMMPKTEVLVNENNQPLMVEDINLQNLLKTINERISYILDRDHQIGHSYFMNWKNYDMAILKNVWFDEIIPLLNEYFYSDWDKLQAILGQANEIGAEKSFIVKIKKPNLPYEADCSDEEAYYNFSKKEETNDDDFKMMLENAKLV